MPVTDLGHPGGAAGMRREAYSALRWCARKWYSLAYYVLEQAIKLRST